MTLLETIMELDYNYVVWLPHDEYDCQLRRYRVPYDACLSLCGHLVQCLPKHARSGAKSGFGLTPSEIDAALEVLGA